MRIPILYVDDNVALVDVVTEFFEDKYKIKSYFDGMQAYRAIQDGLEYELAIVDLSLPNCRGSEIIELSKKMHPEIPVLCVSGYITPKMIYQEKNADRNLSNMDIYGLRKVIDEYLK